MSSIPQPIPPKGNKAIPLHPSSPDLRALAAFLARRNTRAYLVGGYVRDLLLGRPTQDVDVAVEGDALALARAFADDQGGAYVALDAERGVARAVVGGAYFDFSTIATDLRSDLARRDFTVDAMALALETASPSFPSPHNVEMGGGEASALRLHSGQAPARPYGNAGVIDPFGGRVDLEQRVLRAVSSDVFKEDPGRLMRAPRLAVELGLTVEPGTAALVRQQAGLVVQAAPERTRDELGKLMASPRAAEGLRLMDALGLLGAVLPELDPARGCQQPKEHYWDVFDHTMETVAAVERVLEEPPIASMEWVAGHFREEVGGHDRRTLLRLGALFHDIAKPQTKSLQADGRIRFFGHPEEGAKVTSKVMHRLRFGGRETHLVELLVLHHLRPGMMAQPGSAPTRRAVYRYYRELGDAGHDVLFLSLADYLAARGPRLDAGDYVAFVRRVGAVYETWAETQRAVERAPKLLDGHAIMERLGLTPGPHIGRLLAAVQEAQAAGEISTEQEALELVKRMRNASPQADSGKE